jgi:putative endonuclease
MGPRHHQHLGARGEQRAAEWYTDAGYEIVARNWRCREGEIDIVARRRGELVFCEVKARTSARFGAPAEAVTVARQRRLRALAARFLAAAALDGGGRPGDRVRFDVVSVRGPHLDVIEGAF